MKELSDNLEKLIASAFHNSQTGICITDIQGDIQFCNPCFASIYGYTPNYLQEKNFSILFFPDQLKYVEALINQIRIIGGFFSEDLQLRKDGSSFPAWINGSKFKFGKRELIVFFIQNIEEFKLSQIDHDALTGKIEQLKKQQWYELSRKIAHEIKTPLTTIGMAIDTELIPNIENEDMIKTILDIKEEVRRIDDRIKFLLKFPGYEQKQIEKIDIEILLNNVLKIYENSLKQLKITKNYSSTALKILGIKELMIIALQNIISNSLEAMHYQGELKVTTYKQDDNVVLEIEDTGGGIPKHLFDKVIHGYSTKKDGEGKGISDTREILKQFNAEVEIVNKIPHGLLFKVFYPLVS